MTERCNCCGIIIDERNFGHSHYVSDYGIVKKDETFCKECFRGVQNV